MTEYLLNGMFRADAEEMAIINSQNDMYLFQEDLANMRQWRDRKCDELLKKIDTVLQAELHRRFNADANQSSFPAVLNAPLNP